MKQLDACHLCMDSLNFKATNSQVDMVCFTGESNTTNGVSYGDTTCQDAKQYLVKCQTMKSTIFSQFI